MGFSVWLFRFLPKCVSSALPQAQSLICHLLQTNFVTGLCTHFLSTSSTPYDFESYLCCFPSNRSGKDHLWRLWNTMVFWKLLVLVLPPAFCNIDLSSFLEVWSWFLLPSMLLVCLPFSCHSVIVYGVSFLTIVFSQCSDQVIPLLTLYAYLEKYYPNLLLPGINVSGMCVSSPRFLSAL